MLEHDGVKVAYVTDMPETPRPVVRGYRVQVCRCRGCGKWVRDAIQALDLTSTARAHIVLAVG